MTTKLGCTYRDKITEFQGVAVGRVEYISGCNQVLLSPKATDNKSSDAVWFDEQRLALEKTIPAITLENETSPGCDKAAPIR